MALSWTCIARNYRILQHNSTLPTSNLSTYVNSKPSTSGLDGPYTIKQKSPRFKQHLIRCLTARDYSSIEGNKIRDKNVKSFSNYTFLTGCHKYAHKVSLVKEKRSLHTSSSCKSTRLTPTEATNILRKNEYTTDELWTDSGEGNSPVKSFDMNSIRSNNPTEDAHSEAIIRFGTTAPNGMLFGIFDGHGGAACGQVVAKRLLHYVAAGLLSIEDLKTHIDALESQDPENVFTNLLQTINDPFELVAELQSIYQESYKNYVQMLKELRQQETEDDIGSSVAERMITAFNALDEDMSSEALSAPSSEASEKPSDVHMKTLTVALSGCVAVVVHIDGNMLHVASTGDCSAVVGSLSENDTWVAKKLTTEHNSDNQDEINRILSEHPGEKARDIIKGDRLLGILAPLRAFGDYKFKWPAKQIEEVLGPPLSRGRKSSNSKQPPAVPPNYKTPPYLTATPEITAHKLTARDKFMVIGSDGLWDMMTPMQAIRLVGEHMSGKITLTPLNLGYGESSSDQERPASVTLLEINNILRKRQDAMKLKPSDSNAATHLIRSALGGTAYGVEHARLSQMLSLPQDMVRMFRDDMTITVIFFDSEFLRSL